ncbi:MAG: methyltransferase [Candidatus Pacearchaeota archaeon]
MDIYQPAEDSYFLAGIVSDYLKIISKSDKNKMLVLDMGAGSGIQSKNLIRFGIKKQNITAVDMNKDAINETKKIGIKIIKSDLFGSLNKKTKFNLIIFNPPYLPEHKYDKKPDTTGGKKGDETILEFIKELKYHLIEKGVCFLLSSSMTPENRWKAEAKKQNLKVKIIAEKKLFFETLFVWEIKISNQ